MTDAPPTENSLPDDETRRHYAELIAESMASRAAQENRFVLTNMVLCLVLVALVIGLVSADESLEISGISFSLQLSTLLGVLAGVSAALVVLTAGVDQHLEALHNEFWRIYAPLGIGRVHEWKSPVGTASVLELLVPDHTPGRYQVLLNLSLMLPFVFPIVTQFAVVIKIASGADWSIWSLALFILPVISLASFTQARNAPA